MSDAEEEKKTIKVKDSRRVDEYGNLRGEQASTGSPKKDQAEQKHAPKMDEASSQDESSFKAEGVPQDLTEFSRFIMSLAHQAAMFLGDIPVPEGLDMPVDRDAAKHTIDILAMLQTKTEGNLDATEQRFLQEIVHSLQMSFVRSGKE